MQNDLEFMTDIDTEQFDEAEEQFDEKEKPCYHKVKSRYSVCLLHMPLVL